MECRLSNIVLGVKRIINAWARARWLVQLRNAMVKVIALSSILRSPAHYAVLLEL